MLCNFGTYKNFSNPRTHGRRPQHDARLYQRLSLFRGNDDHLIKSCNHLQCKCLLVSIPVSLTFYVSCQCCVEITGLSCLCFDGALAALGHVGRKGLLEKHFHPHADAPVALLKFNFPGQKRSVTVY